MFLRRAPRPIKESKRTPKQFVGDAAESAACEHLTQAGLRVIARNVRYPGSELDIVALDGATLVFVEVRSRQDNRWGSALDSVDAVKRKRIQRAASYFVKAYMRDEQCTVPPCRFDVIAADGGGVTDWVRDAFSVEHV